MMKAARLFLLSTILLVLTTFKRSFCTSVNVDKDCKGGECDLYEQSGYRLQFLGGYHDDSDNAAFFEFKDKEEEGFGNNNNNEMVCYQYKLHEYLHKQGLKQVNGEDDKITVSMQVCPNNNHHNNGNGAGAVVSDYLRKVNIYNEDNNVDNNDTYYVDDTHFYYVSYPGNGNNNDNNEHNNNNTIIELCFSPGEENDDFTHNAKIVTETEYCIQHNNEEKLCSKRGIYMTDICGLDSIHQKYDLNQPAAKIDYVPKPGQLYHVHKSGDMHSLTKGHGYFEINSYLVVVRGWWIDSCIMNEDETEVILSLNDDYFEEITNNNEYIEDFNDLINAPLTLPIYDHFIISSHCHNIHGLIKNYQHNIKNETLTLTIDIASEDVNPLIFFNEAKFKLKQMSLLDLHNDSELIDYTDNHHNDTQTQLVSRLQSQQMTEQEQQEQRRRLRTYKRGFTKTLSLPFDQLSTNYDIVYKRKNKAYIIGNCTFTIEPTASLTLGLKIEYIIRWRNLKKSKLETVYGIIGFEVGLNAIAQCWFGEQGAEDGKIDVEIFSKDYKFGNYKSTIGPLVITTKPWVSVGATLTRPALGVLLEAEANIHSSFYLEAGWDRDDGPFGNVDHSLSHSFDFKDPVFPGSDGRLAAEFAITITPGLTFGLYSKDLLSVGVPIQLPYINAEVALTGAWCVSGFGVKFAAELGLAVLFEVEIERIKILGLTIFKGYSWEPENALFSMKLWDFEKDFSCKSVEEINSVTVFEANYTIEQPDVNNFYDDYPFVLVGTSNSANADEISYEDANSYCSLRFGSTLATVDTTDRYDQVYELVDYYQNAQSQFEWYQPYVGLNGLDNDTDGYWNWEKDDSPYINDSQWSSYSCDPIFNPDQNCFCTVILTVEPNSMFMKNSCHKSYFSSFICDLYNITYTNERYIGVYLYDTYLDWDEANEYCNASYGTELATILSNDNNKDAFYSIWDLMQEHSHASLIKAWFGLYNVSNSDINTFKFADGHDSNDTGYEKWDAVMQSDEHCASLKFSNGESDKKWRGDKCDVKRNALICNRPNVYNTHAYMDFIGVEATEYGLTWDEANHVCESEFGTELASIHSSTETDYLHNVTRHFGWDDDDTKRPWIGVEDASGTNTFSWVDATTYGSYTNWYPNQPNHSGDCGESMPYFANQWNDVGCDEKRKYFICNREKTIFEYNDYIGINTHAEEDGVDGLLFKWTEAETYCNTHYGTHLASIHSAEQQADIEYINNEIDGYQTWLGLKDVSGQNDWEWIDNSTLDYTAWYPGQPDDGSQYCMRIWLYPWEGWTDADCWTQYSSFICNRPATTYETDDYYAINLRNTDQYNWDEANNYCSQTYNTTLASVLNEYQSNQTMDIWNAFGDDGSNSRFFIGLNDKTSEGSHEWIDGNSVSFTKWQNGQPNDWNGQDCSEISDYEWTDIDCNDYYLRGFICNKPISIYQDDTFIGINAHNHKQLNYSEANNYCSDHYGTTLATNVNTQDNYDLIVDMMEGIINSKRVWIGVDDLTTEGTYEWIDGSGTLSTSDSFWYNNQPNNAGNGQDCVEMLIDGFNDQDCNNKMSSFICNNKYKIDRSDNFICVNTYVHNQERFTFDEAESYCNKHFGTHLASIHSNDENNEILSLYTEEIADYYGNTPWVWIGMEDVYDNETWTWIDGSVTNYTSFYRENQAAERNCMSFDDPGLWIETVCSSTLVGFMCNAA